MKKSNLYIIIIVILLIAVAFLAYKQWGQNLFNKSGSGDNKAKTVDVKIFEDDIQIGKTDALVTIVEYYSYLCGYCKLFETDIKPDLVKNYISTGKVRLVLRPFPPYELGQAVLCANDQEKFLEYHNYLFENSDNIQSVDNLKTFAEDIGLDKSEFSQCLDSGKYKARAEEWYKQGESDFSKAGIEESKRGTPAFFINGEAIIGAMPYEDFVKAIEGKLSD